ncbi:DUF1360 domain-containing protein [Streptomyces somaliensis]|uniref:DUF1360 domain-containing protein n=1 Tax=Streptomyces somaliensis (strain ATCC 33201 / DSM 40738 / JCM 12659 / KCTC 9044 / NCTC 11332 / NRRL B-12077 / IP 733) TaxID=1134445 RepID=A0AA44DHD5_STRE0|nr:DUF1360 domain-containing protein [Streptomyces somaliensis]NKY16332.1 DUF1360 domain-containing protein [Streptomyces somaliensis DSM 40738]
MSELITRIAERLRHVYAREEEPSSMGGHAAALAAFTGYTAVWSAAVRSRGLPLPERPEPWDLALTSVATFRLSRLVSKGAVTRPLRAPFTEYRGPQAPAEVHEEPRGGASHTVGELVSCPFCLSVWTVTTLTAAGLLWPRATRTFTGAVTALAGADVLQLAYSALTEKVTGGE